MKQLLYYYSAPVLSTKQAVFSRLETLLDYHFLCILAIIEAHIQVSVHMDINGMFMGVLACREKLLAC